MVGGPCSISLQLELVAWLLRLRIGGGDDLDQTCFFALRRPGDHWHSHVLTVFLRIEGGDLLQKVGWGLTHCGGSSGTEVSGDVWAPSKEQQQKTAQKHFQVGKLDTFDWLFTGVGPLVKAKPTVYFIWATVWATADDGEVLRHAQTIVLVSKAQCQSADVHSFHITVL